MSIELTQLTSEKSSGIIQKPQLVLEIEGVSTKYGVGSIKKYVRIGDPGLYIGDDWNIGGLNEVEDQDDLISLDGTTSSISQQIMQDKGGVNSVSSFQINLIDKDNQITELITPGIVVDDILGRKATVSLGYADTAFPQDFIVIFNGIIDEIISGSNIILNIAHPESKKRAEIFQPRKTKLTANADFRSETIQSIKYQTRRGVVGTVTIEYTNTGTAGLEVVTVVGNAITIAIQSGVSTATQLRNAIEKTPAATSLVSISIVDGQESTVQTTQALTSLTSDTTITVDSTSNFLNQGDALTTYIRINDEIIRYTGTTDTTFTGCTREAFVSDDSRSAGSQHFINDDVSSFYRLQGNAIELALKIMLSGGPANFVDDVEIESFVIVEDVGNVSNAVYFQGINIQDKYGIVPGDFITITGDSNPANNVTSISISSVNITTIGSYITLENSVSLINSINSDAVCSFASKYNVLPEGLAMGGDQVDVPEFERILETYSSSIFEYDYYLTDTINGKDFIDQKLLFPTGAFSLPRKGKISIGYSSPPLALSNLKKLTTDNTSKPGQYRISRSTNKNFYNNLLFKYNNNVLDNNEFQSGDLTQDANSKNRIPVGNKVFTIEVEGLRDTVDNNIIIGILRNRILDRYKFGAEKITAQTFYGDSFNIDVGDVVLFGDENMKLPDTKFGDRNFRPRLFEVVNKSMDIKTGVVKLDLVDTLYSTEGSRFGIFSPSSYIGTGSTTSQISIVDSFGTSAPLKERYKWEDYIGEKVLVHNDDYSISEETTFTGFLSGNDYVMLVSPALSFTPSSGYTVDIADYPNTTNISDSSLSKSIFCFSDPWVQITSGTSNTVFNVGSGDIGKFFIGGFVIIHNDDWTSYSSETKILNIAGNTITVEDDLGFTPDSSYYVDLIGFPDEGYPYRYL